MIGKIVYLFNKNKTGMLIGENEKPMVAVDKNTVIMTKNFVVLSDPVLNEDDEMRMKEIRTKYL